MATSRLPVAFLLLLLLGIFGAEAAPQQGNRNGKNRGGGGNGDAASQTPQQQAAAIAQGVSEATDGSTILDTTANVKYVRKRSRYHPAEADTRGSGVDLRFKVSGPASQFTADSGVDGAEQQAGAQGELGLNVLLHGTACHPVSHGRADQRSSRRRRPVLLRLPQPGSAGQPDGRRRPRAVGKRRSHPVVAYPMLTGRSSSGVSGRAIPRASTAPTAPPTRRPSAT